MMDRDTPRETAPQPASIRGVESKHENPTTPLLIRGINAAAESLSLSPRKVWQLINRNALPHRRAGRAVLFVPAELREWIELDCPTEPDAAKGVRASLRKRGRS